MLLQQTFAFAVDQVAETGGRKKTRNRTKTNHGVPKSSVQKANRPTPMNFGGLDDAMVPPPEVSLPEVNPQESELGQNDPVSNPLSSLDRLRQQAGCVLADDMASDPHSSLPRSISTGSATLDGWLPRGGLPEDGITQYVATKQCAAGQTIGHGAGGESSLAAAFSLIAVAGHLRNPDVRGPLIVVARDHQFYPPAAAAMGIALDRVIWIRPENRRDAVWSIDQSLRCPSVACVWAPIDEGLDPRDARRFQLAAETGHTPAFLIRPPAAAQNRLNFAAVSFQVAVCSQSPGGSQQHGQIQGQATANSRTIPGQTVALDQTGVANQAATLNQSIILNQPASPIIRVTLDRCRGRTDSATTQLQITPSARLIDVSTARTLAPSRTSTIDGQDAIDRRARRRQPAASSSALPLAAQLAHPTTKSAPPKTHKRRRTA